MLDLIKPEAPFPAGGCPFFGSVKSLVFDQGIQPTVEHVFRDRNGIPIDLTPYFAAESTNAPSGPSAGDGWIRMRIKEAVNTTRNAVANPVWEVRGWPVTRSQGVVRFMPGAGPVELSGVYTVEIGLANSANKVLGVERLVGFVERSLFAPNMDTVMQQQGPPSLEDIRMMLLDRAAEDNSLLDAVEFTTEQLLYAMCQPVRYWNETTPVLNSYDTRTYPFVSAWRDMTVSNLLAAAANNYRRNNLPYSAGGVSINDKDKEGPYLAEAARLQEAYMNFVINKKTEMNHYAMFGNVTSPYGTMGGSAWSW